MRTALLVTGWLIGLVLICVVSALLWRDGHDGWSQAIYCIGAPVWLIAPSLPEWLADIRPTRT